jgi:macrolide-specific efflux system membrane fusion protein
MNDTSTSSSRRRRPSRGKLAVIAVAGLAIVGFGAWKYLNAGDDEGEYMFAQVEMGSIEDLVTATGTLEPRDYVDVGAQVSGQIKRIFVEVGDQVKVGDVLAEIDAEQAQARVESNKAQLLSQETNLKNQENNLAKAERDFQRQKNLLAEDATTMEAYLNAETQLKSAQNSIISSTAQIAQQRANMRIEERNLQYTKITAPIEGTVMSIAVKEGQSVNASQSVPNVMKIANLATMTVRADVSEADVSRIYEGMPVYFTTLGADQGRRWYGQLKRIEPTPKNQQGVVLYPALFDVQNEITAQGTALRPQATTQVFLVAAEARDVLTVPMAALQQGQQIAREMAAKEREKNAGKEKEQPAGGPPAAMAANGNVAPPVAAGSAPAGAAAPAAGDEGQRANRQGGGMRAGGFRGPNGQQFTPEQIEEFRRSRGAGGGPGGFGGFRGMGGAPGAGAGGGRQPQQRRGIVMVKKADGSLEQRPVVVGVTDRVRGQVIEGLTEGEEVVVGKRETDPQTGPTAAGATNNNNNNNFRGNQGGFPGGGNFRPF